jgi:imidazolonepropionase-like amidohydrolase
MRSLKVHILTSVMSGVVAGISVGQSMQVTSPRQESGIVIVGATIHPITSAAIPNGWIAVREGIITGVGSGQPPEVQGSQLVDASGLHVYPGLIAAATQMGLTETGAVEVTHDHNEYGTVTPEAKVIVAINPDTDHIPVTRSAGILTCQVLPDGGRVAGQAAVIRMDGWTWEDLAIDRESGLVVTWPSTSSETTARRSLDDLIHRATAYFPAREADPLQPTDPVLEAMRSTIVGGAPIYVRANSAEVIESAVVWAAGHDLEIIIVGGAEADRVAPLLKAHDVGIIITGVHRFPGARHGGYDEAYALPARLSDAGVRFCIAAGESPAHLRNLSHHAATAAAFGLTPEEAIASITIDAAVLIGRGDDLGALEPGRAGTLIITTGNPLEVTTVVRAALIDGSPVDLSNRQTQLFQKYRQKYTQQGLIAGSPVPRAGIVANEILTRSVETLPVVYRAKVKDAIRRAGANGPELIRAVDSCPAAHQNSLAFLLAYMPAGDLASISAPFLLENVALAEQARIDAPWYRNLPDEIYLNYVLPYAQVTESRDPWRADFVERFAPAAHAMPRLEDAVEALNGRVFEELGVQYHASNRPRTDQSPSETIDAGFASCTGLSIMLADALRSVGIPARLAGTPLWMDHSGNHTWVEVWDGRQWRWVEAASPSGFDETWFNAKVDELDRSTPRHRVYAVSWTPTGTHFPMVWAEDARFVHAIDVTDRYQDK